MQSGTSDSITANLKNEIISKGEGRLYTLDDFIHYGNDEAVKRAIARFANEGFLERITRGIYLYPKKTIYGPVKPTSMEIADAIARRDKVEVLPTGNVALNALGISEQVPMNAVFATTGSTRNVSIGNRQFTFKHKSPRYFVFKNRTFALIVAAMKELGEGNISEENTNRIISILSQIEDKESLREDLNNAPKWIRNIIAHS